jgi:hypothetical protein
MMIARLDREKRSTASCRWKVRGSQLVLGHVSTYSEDYVVEEEVQGTTLPPVLDIHLLSRGKGNWWQYVTERM